MIDIEKSKKAFKDFLKQYENDEDKAGFNLKVVHTYHVAETSKKIAVMMNLDEEDIKLAELIGLLHDIGRFEELKVTSSLDNSKFNHGMYGSKILFQDGLIRKFIDDNSYDSIIQKAVENHNKLCIEDGLNKRELLHAKLIRDADKIDNYRVKREEKIENIFPGQVKSIEDMENSKISDKVYESVLDRKLVNINDRVYPLDYWICILAFVFDMYFPVTLKLMKEQDNINSAIDKFNYKNEDSKQKMEIIRKVTNDFIKENSDE